MALKINWFTPTLAVSILSSLSNLRAEPLSGGSICPSVIFSMASHAQRTLKTSPTDVSALWHMRLPFGRSQEGGTEAHGLIGVGGHDLLCHRKWSGSFGLFLRYGLLDLTTHYQPVFFMENLNLTLLRGGLEQVEVKAKYGPDSAWSPVISLRPFALRKEPKYNMGIGLAFNLSKYIQFGGGVQLPVPLAFEAPKRVNGYFGFALKESQSQPSLWMIRSLTTQITIEEAQKTLNSLLESRSRNQANGSPRKKLKELIGEEELKMLLSKGANLETPEALYDLLNLENFPANPASLHLIAANKNNQEYFEQLCQFAEKTQAVKALLNCLNSKDQSSQNTILQLLALHHDEKNFESLWRLVEKTGKKNLFLEKLGTKDSGGLSVLHYAMGMDSKASKANIPVVRWMANHLETSELKVLLKKEGETIEEVINRSKLNPATKRLLLNKVNQPSSTNPPQAPSSLPGNNRTGAQTTTQSPPNAPQAPSSLPGNNRTGAQTTTQSPPNAPQAPSSLPGNNRTGAQTTTQSPPKALQAPSTPSGNNGSGVQAPTKASLEGRLNNILTTHTNNKVSLKSSLRDFLFEAYSTNGATNFQAMIELGVALDDQFFEALKLLPEGDLDSLLSDAAPTKQNQPRPALKVELGSVWNLLSWRVASAYFLELAKLEGKDNPEVAALLAKEYTPEVAALLAAADRTIYDLFLCLPDQAQREYFCAKLPTFQIDSLATLLRFFSDKALIDKIINHLLPKLFNNPQGHDVGRGKFYPQLQLLFDSSKIISNLPEEVSKYKKQHKEVLKRYVEILKPILKDNPKAVGDLDTKWKEYEKLNP